MNKRSTQSQVVGHARDILAAHLEDEGVLPDLGPARYDWLLRLVLRAFHAARSSRYPAALRVYDHLGRKIPKRT